MDYKSAAVEALICLWSQTPPESCFSSVMHLAENVYFCNVSGNREVNLTSLQLPYKYCRWPQQNPYAWLQLQGTEAGKTASLLIGIAVQVQVSAPSEGATIAMAVLKLRRADGTKNWYGREKYLLHNGCTECLRGSQGTVLGYSLQGITGSSRRKAGRSGSRIWHPSTALHWCRPQLLRPRVTKLARRGEHAFCGRGQHAFCGRGEHAFGG